MCTAPVSGDSGQSSSSQRKRAHLLRTDRRNGASGRKLPAVAHEPLRFVATLEFLCARQRALPDCSRVARRATLPPATEMKTLAVGFLLALLLGFAPPTAAQSTSATVFGSASDEQHGALPGVTITLQRLDTGESRTVAT